MEIATGNAVASPTPTRMRVNARLAKLSASPVIIVAADQRTIPAIKISLRFFRSTQRAMNTPTTRLNSTKAVPVTRLISVSDSWRSAFTGSITIPSKLRSA